MNATSGCDTVATFRCEFCSKDFRRETTLFAHMCEPKRRHRERDEVGVRMGLAAYLRFYEITQGSARLKSWQDFAGSAYYRAFVRFGRHCQAIRAINAAAFTDWLIRSNHRLDHWCQDSIYAEYLVQYVRHENINDALTRSIEHSLEWARDSNYPAQDYLRFGNDNAICYAVSTGRISPWILYNSDSGQEFLSRINPEQISMTWCMIDSDFWQKKFRDYPADAAYVREIMTKAGW